MTTKADSRSIAALVAIGHILKVFIEKNIMTMEEVHTVLEDAETSILNTIGKTKNDDLAKEAAIAVSMIRGAFEG